MAVIKLSPSYYLNNTAIVADGLQKLQTAKSMDDLTVYMRDTYGINNFSVVYKKFEPYLKGLKSLAPLPTSSSTKNSFLGWNGMLTAAGISKESKTFAYIRDMHLTMQSLPAHDNGTVVSAIKSLREGVMKDGTISESERSTLISLSNMLIVNYDGIVKGLLNPGSSKQHDEGGSRIEGFWDIFISVIITVLIVATAFVGLAAAFIEVGWLAETELIVGLGTWVEVDVYAAAAVIGAVVGAGDAAYQAISNGNCYTFSCGEDENIGLMNCSSQQCQAI